MAHLSRPFQIALVAFGLLVAVWFFALRGHSSTSSPGSAATVAAPTPAPSASAQAQKAAAPTSVYHGPAPGVGGLTRALAKAHGAVATSQQNAKQLEQKSAQASSAASAAPAPSASPTGGQAAPSSTPRSAAVTPAPHGNAVKSTTTPATPAAGSSTGSEARSGPNRTPARQALVERALKEGKIAVVLFWNPKGADDVAVRNELRLLEAVHHLIRPFAGVPAVRQRLTRSGLELDKKFAAFVASAKQVTSFGTITRGVQVYGTPTLLVINKRGQVTTLTGLTDAYSIEQAIDEARHS
jgi:hypothetical protein